jgi:hypothetical protein
MRSLDLAGQLAVAECTRKVQMLRELLQGSLGLSVGGRCVGAGWSGCSGPHWASLE